MNAAFPLPADHANVVLANQVLEPVIDPSHFVSEARRILKPGGIFVLATPNIRYLRHLARLVVIGRGPRTGSGRMIDGPWDDGHCHYFTHKDLNVLLAGSGLRCLRAQALIGLKGGGVHRRLLDAFADVGIVREFLSGNALVVASK